MNDFYVIGDPIKQSKSPLLFNYIFKKLNINKTYGAYQIENPHTLSNFIDSCIKNHVVGINITMPLKESINKYVSAYDKTAQITKAINCIHFKNNNVIRLNIHPGENIDVVSDGTHYPFEDETFDKIMLRCLLEHVDDPKVILKEAARVLKPKGKIVIEVPFINLIHAAPDYFFDLRLIV